MDRSSCHTGVSAEYLAFCRENECHFRDRCPVARGKVTVSVAFTTPLENYSNRRQCANEIAEQAAEEVACRAFENCEKISGEYPTVTRTHGLLHQETCNVPIAFCGVGISPKGSLKNTGVSHGRYEQSLIRGIK